MAAREQFTSYSSSVPEIHGAPTARVSYSPAPGMENHLSRYVTPGRAKLKTLVRLNFVTGEVDIQEIR